jgi:hypothetical protein
LKIIKSALHEVLPVMILGNPELSLIIPDRIIELCDFCRKISI